MAAEKEKCDEAKDDDDLEKDTSQNKKVVRYLGTSKDHG